jgi:hypothetical protein
VNRALRKVFAMLAVTGLGLAASPVWGQGRTQESHVGPQPTPEFGKIEFENELVTVVRVHMAPHERTPMHDIPSPRLVVWLTDAHLRDTGADGRVSEYNRAAGSSDWITPRRHMGENLSDQDLDFLAIIPSIAVAPGSHGAPAH